jgi:predicted aldo/keto reductase-like oxidoreductase
MRRRRFLEMSVAGVLGAGQLAQARSGQTTSGTTDALPRRPLGTTREALSVIGLGGMALADETPEVASRLVWEAFENGVNYFDVAPSYGNAEDLLGPALKPFRKKVFLACKTLARDNQGAELELSRSLEKLQTDYLDLYQFHALTKTEEVEKIFGPGGAAEAFLKAKKDGRIRFIGFSAHSTEAALLALDEFPFDTILFPVNYVSFLGGGFGSAVIEKARAKGPGILAIKALAQTPWREGEGRAGCPKCWYRPILDPAEQGLALRFTLSQPVTAAVPPGDPAIFRSALRLGKEASPLTEGELGELRERAARLKPVFGAPRGL